MNSFVPKVEVCAYSLFSCMAADRAGAHRVELCTSPWDGGTTPSSGLVKAVKSNTSIEVHAMLRPRGGDFCYDSLEKDTIRYELESLIDAGVDGIVIGALLPNGDLDGTFLEEMKRKVGDLPITCHRAIDVAKDTIGSVGILANLGFTRILTSGQRNRAIDGLETIARMVEVSNNRIEIMAGSGVNEDNYQQFLSIGCHAIHLSARKSKRGLMEFQKPGISMGGLEGVSEFDVFYADQTVLTGIINRMKIMNYEL